MVGIYGPSEDFILGRLFEASKGSLRAIFYENKNTDIEKYLDDSLRFLKAETDIEKKTVISPDKK